MYFFSFLISDIDECDSEPTGSGSIDMNTTSPNIDDEPEVCDYNAQCRNTLGSYQCICNEGYVMGKRRCEFAPPGSKSKNDGGRGDTGSTEPPPKDYSWFDRMVWLLLMIIHLCNPFSQRAHCLPWLPCQNYFSITCFNYYKFYSFTPKSKICSPYSDWSKVDF